MSDVGMQLVLLRNAVAHFELRPMDRAGREWQISWRDISTPPPAYSGAVRGTLQDVVVRALDRVNQPDPAPATTQPEPRKGKTMRRR